MSSREIHQITGLHVRKLKRKFVQTLYFPDGYPLLFVSNAKAACSTVKRSLWRAARPETLTAQSNVHNRKDGPFADDIATVVRMHLSALPRLAKFSVVRNPYARVISAYRNKVLRNLNTKAWKEMAARYGLRPDEAVSLETLLTCLREDDPYWIDPHFAPQTVNLSLDLIDFDLICQLEKVEVLERFLGDHNVQMTSHRAHQTNAGQITDFATVLSPRELDLVAEIYADDFAAFHYAFDPAQTQPTAPVVPQPKDEALLQTLMSLAGAENGQDLHAAAQAMIARAPQLASHPLLQANG
ncbi:MAG: sulfotransferase family protein [Pseudomonadota bacterium]